MRRALRFAIPALAVLLFGLLVLLYIEAPQLYFPILRGWGLGWAYRFPIIDIHEVLAAIECKRLGYEVFLANPCDFMRRPFPYSPLFLEAAIWPLSVMQTMAAGITMSLAFFVALASLPTPQGRLGWIVAILATVSTMTALAVERANTDLFIFMIVAVVGPLALSTGATRWLAYALILLGAFLKFYPVTLLILALREKPRAFVAIIVGSVIFIALFVLFYRASLPMAFRNAFSALDRPYFQDQFGAVDLPYGIASVLRPLAELYPATMPALAILPWVLMALLMLFSLSVAIANFPMINAHVPTLAPAPAIFLIAGAMPIVFIFFVGQSPNYRGIFFLFQIPALCLLARQEPFFARTTAAILFLMWGDFFRHGIELPHIHYAPKIFWLVHELIWWYVIGILASVLIQFAISSEIGTALLPRRMRAPCHKTSGS
jgi:hypothetical protein